MVKTHGDMRLIPADDILYMDLVGQAAHYHLLSGPEINSLTLCVPFQVAAAPLLAGLRFIQFGTSFVVNLYYVTALEDGCFCLDDGNKIPLYRTAAPGFQDFTKAFPFQGLRFGRKCAIIWVN